MITVAVRLLLLVISGEFNRQGHSSDREGYGETRSIRHRQGGIGHERNYLVLAWEVIFPLLALDHNMWFALPHV